MVLRAAGAAEQADGQLVENGADSRQEQVQHDCFLLSILGKISADFLISDAFPGFFFQK